MLHGKVAAIVGLVCMDQLIVDVTDIPKTASGDMITLLGKDGEKEITAYDLAEEAGTITNEVLSRLGNRLERIWAKK